MTNAQVLFREDRYKGRGVCVEFCPHQVLKVNEAETPKLKVKNPNNCVVFCRACAKTCGLDAITFPDKPETTKMIKAMRKADKEAKASE